MSNSANVNRKWPFYFDGFAHIFSQIVSIRVKKLSNTNFTLSRLVKREKASLPVDVRRSKRLCLSSLIARVTRTLGMRLQE